MKKFRIRSNWIILKHFVSSWLLSAVQCWLLTWLVFETLICLKEECTNKKILEITIIQSQFNFTCTMHVGLGQYYPDLWTQYRTWTSEFIFIADDVISLRQARMHIMNWPFIHFIQCRCHSASASVTSNVKIPLLNLRGSAGIFFFLTPKRRGENRWWIINSISILTLICQQRNLLNR